MNSARVCARKVLPTPVGPRKINEPIGRRGSFKSARERRSAFEIATTASSCPTTLPLNSSSILRSFSVSFCSIRCNGTPVTFWTMCIMSSPVTVTCLSSRSSRHRAKILRLDRFFFFDAHVFDLLFDFFHVGWPRHRVDARARARLVHHINRFIRQKPPGDVTIGKFHRDLARFVGQLGFVMRFILWPQPFQNLYRFLDRRRIHFHGLEPSLQGRVFLDVLAILV